VVTTELGPDEVLLANGTPVLVRPITPDDAGALVALHARLSADTIYRRYFGARPHLSPADVDRFTRVDGRARFALVAMRAPEAGAVAMRAPEAGAMVAVARYEGRPGGHSAELAVVVDDALQRSGLGRLMLRRLMDVAREAGQDELVADVLVGNAAMLGLLRGLGLPRRIRSDGETVTVVLDLTHLMLSAGRRARARAHLARAGVGEPSP
jgi:RimJ/RimL family protein N-acetyltransferase